MLSEINIVQIVKSRRYFQMAFRLLLSKKNRDWMRERSRYITVDPDKSSGSEGEELEMRRQATILDT